MTPSIATTHPSDLFSEAVSAITVDGMAKVLSCSRTHIYKQAAHPERNGEARTSFIEKAERMLTSIMEKNPTIARKIVDRLCRHCGGKFVATGPSKADKGTLAEELLDNVPAFSRYMETRMDRTATLEEQREAFLSLVDELEQDFDERLFDE